MRGRALLLVAAACNQFFDIDRTAPAPADAVDGDLDGTPDATDNCPAIANPTQTDLDADGPGDACDNCPVVANSGQADEADRDGVGDQCDPHPEDAGDCLVLIDSFSDAALLAEHWRIEGVGTVTPQTGGVVLESPPGARLRWIALDPSGAPLAGSFDVQARIRATFVAPDASIELISRAPDATTGLGCSVDQSGVSQLAVARVRQPTSSTLAGYTLGFSSAPLGDNLVLRLSTTSSDGTPDIRCRADFGISVGFSAVRDAYTIAQIPELPPGPAGISVVGQAFVLDAFALYRFQPGVECTPTVMR